TALIETHPESGERRVKETRPITGEGISGFAATLLDGGTVTWLASDGQVRTLESARVTIEGDGLLVFQKGDEITGLALGAKSIRIGGATRKLPATDFEFGIRDGRLVDVKAIHRPIEPVTFSPQEGTFTHKMDVTLSSATPGVEIRY